MEQIKLVNLKINAKLFYLLTEQDIENLGLNKEDYKEQLTEKEEFYIEWLFTESPYYHNAFEGLVIFKII